VTVQRILQDNREIARKHVGENRSGFDQSGIAMAGLLAGAFMAVDQDHLPPALLQVQGRADADHARAEHQNIGLQFRHPGTPKVECNALSLVA
jgi:5-deoxy-D-glucuronate isomerase